MLALSADIAVTVAWVAALAAISLFNLLRLQFWLRWFFRFLEFEAS